MIYVGKREYKLGRMKMSHMASPDLEELHEMARSLSIQKHFQDKQGRPHYDVSKHFKKLAIELGAIEVDDRELINKCFKSTHP